MQLTPWIAKSRLACYQKQEVCRVGAVIPTRSLPVETSRYTGLLQGIEQGFDGLVGQAQDRDGWHWQQTLKSTSTRRTKTGSPLHAISICWIWGEAAKHTWCMKYAACGEGVPQRYPGASIRPQARHMKLLRTLVAFPATCKG